MNTPVKLGLTTLHIDWTACDRRALCVELVPELLGLDDWGYPIALGYGAGSGSDIPVPPSSRAGARDAVGMCPRLALSLRASA